MKYVFDTYTKLYLPLTNSTKIVKRKGTNKGIITEVGTVTRNPLGRYFGNSGWLTVADSNDWFYGTSDWFYSLWLYLTAYTSGANTGLIAQYNTSYICLVLDSDSHKLRLAMSSPSIDFQSTSVVPLNKWTHLAVSRNGSNFYLYVNGVRENTASNANSIVNVSDSLYIGRHGTGAPAHYCYGYISDVYLNTGIDRAKGANFNPPPKSLPWDNLSLLNITHLETGSHIPERAFSGVGEMI